MSEVSEFDVIFAGGGTTACIIAGRLISADPSLKILIVEKGPHTRDLPIHAQPCRFIENMAPTSTTISLYATTPSNLLNGRALFVPAGRCVGGGSAINFMAYTRGAASDYDDWAALGNEGWGFDDLLPLVKKAETFSPRADQATHGYDGPIQISTGQAHIGIAKEFLDVGQAYEPHRPCVDDNNDFKTANAYGPWNKYIDSKTGKRSDTASTHLYPHAHNPNLNVRVGMCVKRIMFKNGRAVGIQYIADTTTSPETVPDVVTARASKLVVVSAGTFGSPAVLERSGIGNPSVLRQSHVSVVVDLLGVGENYRDHIRASTAFYASSDAYTADASMWNDLAVLSEWKTHGTGEIIRTGLDAMMKFRPDATELASIGPAFQTMWENFFKYHADKPVAIVAPYSGYFGDRSALPLGQKLFSMEYFLMYPGSVGSAHITSGEDVNAPLDIDPRFFSEPGDVACLTMLYKKEREIARRMPTYRGEVASCHPLFAVNSPAACRKTDGPVTMDASDIAYSAEDDRAIEAYLHNSILATGHSLGTCSMKPREQGGVVDARLNVYGVTHLKVADMSICPTNVSTNTYSTALMIGEKAAVIIAQDLGIKLV